MDQDASKLVMIMELKKAERYTSSSGDATFRLVLETSDPRLLALGNHPPDMTVRVTVESEERLMTNPFDEPGLLWDQLFDTKDTSDSRQTKREP